MTTQNEVRRMITLYEKRYSNIFTRHRKLAQQGYCGWILRLRETREDHWPDDRWLVDHSVDDTIGWVEQF